MINEEGSFYQTEVLIGPGTRLRLAREACQISQEEVAERLRLKTETIVALEQDDFKLFPALVYVRGYLRAYANLVGANPKEIIEVFNNLNLIEQPSERPTLPLGARHQLVLTKQPLYRYLSYAGIVLLLIVGGIWWFLQKDDPHQVTTLKNALLNIKNEAKPFILSDPTTEVSKKPDKTDESTAGIQLGKIDLSDLNDLKDE